MINLWNGNYVHAPRTITEHQLVFNNTTGKVTRRALSIGTPRHAYCKKKYGEGEVRTHDLLAGKQKKKSNSPASNPGPTKYLLRTY